MHHSDGGLRLGLEERQLVELLEVLDGVEDRRKLRPREHLVGPFAVEEGQRVFRANPPIGALGELRGGRAGVLHAPPRDVAVSVGVVGAIVEGFALGVGCLKAVKLHRLDGAVGVLDDEDAALGHHVAGENGEQVGEIGATLGLRMLRPVAPKGLGCGVPFGVKGLSFRVDAGADDDVGHAVYDARRYRVVAERVSALEDEGRALVGRDDLVLRAFAPALEEDAEATAERGVHRVKHRGERSGKSHRAPKEMAAV